MAKSIFDLKSRRVIFYDFAPDQSPHDVHAFLQLLHETLGEPLDVKVSEDRLELCLERAPKSWEILNGLREGKVRPSYDGTYIHFRKATPPN